MSIVHVFIGSPDGLEHVKFRNYSDYKACLNGLAELDGQLPMTICDSRGVYRVATTADRPSNCEDPPDLDYKHYVVRQTANGAFKVEDHT
jgi:hypothetical protein